MRMRKQWIPGATLRFFKRLHGYEAKEYQADAKASKPLCILTIPAGNKINVLLLSPSKLCRS